MPTAVDASSVTQCAARANPGHGEFFANHCSQSVRASVGLPVDGWQRTETRRCVATGKRICPARRSSYGHRGLAPMGPIIVPLAGCLLAGQGSRNSDCAGGEEVAESCRQLLGCVLGDVVAAGDGAAAQLGGPGPPDGEDVAAEVFQVVAADHSTSVGQVVRRPAARSAPSASRSTPSPAR